MCRQVYQAMREWTVDLPDAVSIPLSAGTAGFFLSFVLSPAELVKACRGTSSRLRGEGGRAAGKNLLVTVRLHWSSLGG